MPDKKVVSMEDLHGINITSGVPSEIHVRIDRGHYDDEPDPLHAVAQDVAAAFTGPGRMLLILDKIDYRDIQAAITRRQKLFDIASPRMDGQSNLAGAVLAWHCRVWSPVPNTKESLTTPAK